MCRQTSAHRRCRTGGNADGADREGGVELPWGDLLPAAPSGGEQGRKAPRARTSVCSEVPSADSGFDRPRAERLKIPGCYQR